MAILKPSHWSEKDQTWTPAYDQVQLQEHGAKINHSGNAISCWDVRWRPKPTAEGVKALPAPHGGVTQQYIPAKFSESAPQICTFHNRFTAHKSATDKSPALVRDVHTDVWGRDILVSATTKCIQWKMHFRTEREGQMDRQTEVNTVYYEWMADWWTWMHRCLMVLL